MAEGSSNQRPPTITEEKAHRPIILRTGIGYKYRPSITFCLVVLIVYFVLLLVAGVPFLVISSDFATWLSLVLILFTTYIFRNTILEFDAMFNVFGESREDRTSLVKGIFDSEDEFRRYQLRLRKTIRSRLDILLGILGVLAVIAIGPTYWGWTNFIEIEFHGYLNSLTTVTAYVALITVMFEGFLLGAGGWIVLSIIMAVSLIGRSLRRRAPQTAIIAEDERKPRSQDRLGNLDITSQFFEFHRSVREVGAFMYRFCLKLTLLAFVWITFYISIDLFIRRTGYVDPGTMQASIVLMLVIFAFFVIPQLGTHGLLARKKDDVIRQLDRAYGRINSAFLQSMADRDFLKQSTIWKDRAEIREDSQVIKEMLNHVKGMGVWSFSFPTVLKLIAATALPLLAAIVQALGMGLLTPLLQH